MGPIPMGRVRYVYLPTNWSHKNHHIHVGKYTGLVPWESVIGFVLPFVCSICYGSKVGKLLGNLGRCRKIYGKQMAFCENFLEIFSMKQIPQTNIFVPSILSKSKVWVKKSNFQSYLSTGWLNPNWVFWVTLPYNFPGSQASFFRMVKLLFGMMIASALL